MTVAARSESEPPTSVIVIPGGLVKHLREGVTGRMVTSLLRLTAVMTAGRDLDLYEEELGRFDAERALLDLIGLVDRPQQSDVEIDLGRWPELVRIAVQSRYLIEAARVEDALADGIELPSRDIAELHDLVLAIRAKTEAQVGGSQLPGRRRRWLRASRPRHDV